MSILKRMTRFKKHDWKHVFWLVKVIVKSWLRLDSQAYQEAKFFLKLHLTCDSELIEQEDADNA